MFTHHHPPSSSLTLLLVAFPLLAAAGCRPEAGETLPDVERASSDGPVAGTGSGNAPGKTLPGVSSECASFATFSAGPYKYENNQWGSSKVKGKFEQCLLKRERAGRTEYGWTWDFPGVDPSVFAYPEIIYGWKPWSGGSPSDARFPLRVADVGQLSIVYEVETEASGHYNLAPEVWLTREKPRSFSADPSLISVEIMFWMESAGRARPAGGVVDRPTIAGTSYELWKMEGAGDPSQGQRWTLLSFTVPDTRRKGTLPIHELLEYLVAQDHVDASHYVASVEFGNEISGGAGTTWVKRFEVQVTP